LFDSTEQSFTTKSGFKGFVSSDFKNALSQYQGAFLQILGKKTIAVIGLDRRLDNISARPNASVTSFYCIATVVLTTQDCLQLFRLKRLRM
jgi:hypothetical protein